MIATRRGLAVLAAIALVLAIVVALDARRRPASMDRSLAAGLAVDRITGLRWERPGGPGVALVREGERWRWRAPVAADADPGAVASVLATLRAARWHRRAQASAAGATPRALTITTDEGATRTLRFGQPLEGAEQAWIVDGDHAVLVDRWIARALDPDDLVALAVRQPFADAASAAVIDVGGTDGVRLEGAPRRRVRPSAVLVAPALARALEDALAALTIVTLVEPAPAAAAGLPVEVGGLRGTVHDADGCGGRADLARLESAMGTGCVDRRQVAAVRAAMEALRGPARAVIDPRLAPIEATRIVLVDGTPLELAGTPRVGPHPADPARVAELLAVLAAPAEIDEAPVRGAAGGARTLTVTDRAGASIVLELRAPRRVRRAGEAVTLRLTPAAWEVLMRSPAALRELALWTEDPLALTAIAIDGVTYRRGAVVGEWTRAPAGAAAPGAVEALAITLAAPRVLAFAAPAFRAIHRVTLTITPPGGAPSEHVLELGAATPRGCPARADGVVVQLPPAICQQVSALAR